MIMLKHVYAFLADILKMRGIIFELAKRDFQQQYMGSYLGFVWVFLQPLIFIYILYIIFSLGLRENVISEVPFSLYLITGIVAWLYFAENLSSTTHVIKSHVFLVKKVDFRLSVLPVVKLISSLVSHLFLVMVAVLISWYQGYSPTVYTLQVFYYMFCLFSLLLGIAWITSATSIFIKDVVKLVAIFVQFGFWLTPVFWNKNMLPEEYYWIVEVNPVNYIVTGYRDSILSQVPFWQKPEEMLYFWGVSLAVMLVGIKVFRKLRPHFAEVV